MLSKEELKTIEFFKQDLFKTYSILEIMKSLHKRSYSGVFNIIKKLEKLGMIKIEKKGQANICSLNLKNNLTLAYLSLTEELNAIKSKHLPHKNINELISNIKTPFFIFLVTGSYASKKQTPKSDLDIVIIIDDSMDKKKISASLNKGELMIPAVHSYVFTKSEFFEMLTNKEKNYGKEIATNKIIIYGAYAYYKILEEAIEYGYKG